ncbi:MAG: DUF429 domain-containing protein [Candidatus Aenigmatarchaeota archaeon]
MHRDRIIFCGIDLAGSEKRISGIAFMNLNLEVFCYSAYTNNEILDLVEKNNPKFIFIDAPLSLPKDRKSLEKVSNIHFRKCDLELKKLKIKFFPITLGPMRMLTMRGILLKKLLSKKGRIVKETFPGAFYDLKNLKRRNLEEIYNFFQSVGLRFLTRIRNIHEMDAITCVFIAYLYYNGRAKEIGEKKEGTIVIPAD